MTVKCINNDLNSADPQLLKYAFHQNKETGKVDLMPDKTYTVYGIRKNDLGKFYLVLTDEINTHVPWWMPASLFKIVDNSIPTSWQTDAWEGYGHESVEANPIYFDATLDLEDGTPRGYEVFEVMKKDAEGA